MSSLTSDIYGAMMQVLCLCSACALFHMHLTKPLACCEIAPRFLCLDLCRCSVDVADSWPTSLVEFTLLRFDKETQNMMGWIPLS